MLEEFIHESVGTTYQLLGMYKMQPRQWKCVVDAKLNAYGVGKLKIVNLNIAPANVAANTNATASMVRETSAGVVIRELGLQSV